MIYAPEANYYGATFVNFTVYAGDCTIDAICVSVGARSPPPYSVATTIVPVQIAPVSDAPVLTLSSSSLVAQVGSLVNIVGMSIADPDDLVQNDALILRAPLAANATTNVRSVLLLTMTVDMGYLYAPSVGELSPGERIPVSWRSSAEVVLKGPAASINAVLRFVKYNSQLSSDVMRDNTDGTAVNGALTIVVKSLSSGLSTNASVALRLISRSGNIAPFTIVVPTTPPRILEDSRWSLQSLALVGSANVVSANMTVEILLVCEVGMFIVETANVSRAFHDKFDILSQGPVLHLRATSLRALNAVLNASSLIPPPNFFGSVATTISAVGNPFGSSPSTLSGSFLLIVDAVDDGPLISVQGGSSMLTSTVTGPVALTLFEVSDVDDMHFMKIELRCSHCGLSLIAGLSNNVIALAAFKPNPSNLTTTTSRWISFLSNPASCSRILHSVLYTPDTGYLGTDVLVLKATSLLPAKGLAVTSTGITGVASDPSTSYTEGASTSVNVTLNVAYADVDDLSIVCPVSLDLLEDDSFVLGTLCDFQAGILVGYDMLTVVLAVRNGADTSNRLSDEMIVSAAATKSPWFSFNNADDVVLSSARIISSAASTDLTVEVAPWDVSALLALITLRPPAHINGDFTLLMSVTSSQAAGGQSSKRVPLSNLKRVFLHIVAVNDAPTITNTLPTSGQYIL